jgi:hypothetical protein
MTFGGVDNATPAVDAGRFPELDPLGLEPRVSSVPPPWIDPMLEEFAASRQEARPLLDTSSPGMVAHDGTASVVACAGHASSDGTCCCRG